MEKKRFHSSPFTLFECRKKYLVALVKVFKSKEFNKFVLGS